MKNTLDASRLRIKREAAENRLGALLQLRQQARIKAFRSKLQWQGDLDAMRSDAGDQPNGKTT